jgi:hypothetical protein
MTNFEEQAKQYLILIEGGPPSNYSAWSPDLPGCVATGDTLEEVEREMRGSDRPTPRGARRGRRADPAALRPRRLRRARRSTRVSPTRRGAFELHDGVRLGREVDGFPAGTEGFQVFPEQNAYGVELFEAAGPTIGLVDATGDELERSPEQLG